MPLKIVKMVSMLNYNEIKEKRVIIYENEPWLVLSSNVFRKQARKPVNATKLKNLVNGRVVETTFHVSDKVNEADMEKKDIKYIFEKKGEYWFNDPENPKDRFFLTLDVIGNQIKFMKENMVVRANIFNEKSGEETIIGIDLPTKVEFEVTDAPPSIKGNTASGGDKLVTLETGAKITVPLFIEAGNRIIINTEKGEYVERAK